MSTFHTDEANARTATVSPTPDRMNVTRTSVWSKRKSVLAASATALGAIGILTVPGGLALVGAGTASAGCIENASSRPPGRYCLYDSIPQGADPADCYSDSLNPAMWWCPPPGRQLGKSQIKLRYGPPSSFGITAFVSIIHNEKSVSCTYQDGFNLPRPFTVTGSAESKIDIAGIPTGTTFHVTVACDNGLTHQEDKTF